MLLIGDPSNKDLSESLGAKLDLVPSYPEITVFPDSEQRVRIAEVVSGQKVLIVKSITSPVDSALMQLAFLADAARQNGADKIIGIIPYLPYMRADHIFRSGEAVPLEIVIKLIESVGFHEVVMVDPHSVKTPEVFKIPVHDLTALSVFAEKIKEIENNSGNITIVSPDMGGIRRLKLLDEILGGVNQVIINKDRDYESGHVKVAAYEGDIRGTCFIVDDIISTGKTIVQAVDKLLENGAKEVYVFGTHAVFSENAVELLNTSKAKKIFITDSLPVDRMFEKLETLSIAGIISGKIRD